MASSSSSSRPRTPEPKSESMRKKDRGMSPAAAETETTLDPEEPQIPSCDIEQYLTFDGACFNSSGCSTSFPTHWPGHPHVKPQLVCRDCGCRYEMLQESDCRHLTPDFSEARHHGYQLEISHPNACNEIYFNFIPKRCVPPNIYCTCPLCRRKLRLGDHFRDCSCALCNARREKCPNKLRRQFLEENKRLEHNNQGQWKIPRCCVPLPNHKYYGMEDDVPKSGDVNCACHMFAPSYWQLKEPCEHYKTFSKQLEEERKEIEKKKRASRKTGNKRLTESFSQTKWGLPIPCPCPEYILTPEEMLAEAKYEAARKARLAKKKKTQIEDDDGSEPVGNSKFPKPDMSWKNYKQVVVNPSSSTIDSRDG